MARLAATLTVARLAAAAVAAAVCVSVVNCALCNLGIIISRGIELFLSQLIVVPVNVIAEPRKKCNYMQTKAPLALYIKHWTQGQAMQ